MRLKFVGRRIQSQREPTTLSSQLMRSCELQQQEQQSQSLYKDCGTSNSQLSEEDIVMEEKPDTASEVELRNTTSTKQHYQEQTCTIDINMERPLMFGCEDSWTWNKRDRSQEVRLSGPNCRTVHFHPNWSKGTAGIRGNRVLNNGRYYWEIKVSQRVFGTR